MADAVPQHQDLKRFEGAFLVWKINSKAFTRKLARKALPWIRHETFADAEAEARRLNLLFPESTFCIIQEVGRVKMVEAVVLDVAA
jgi:hypothetical protein